MVVLLSAMPNVRDVGTKRTFNMTSKAKTVEEIREEIDDIIIRYKYDEDLPEAIDSIMAIEVGGEVVEKENNIHPMNILTNVCTKCELDNDKARYRKCRISRPRTLRDLIEEGLKGEIT
jgi:hypothetical protein